MEEKTRSTTVHGMYYGLITGLAIVIFSLILFISDLYQNQWINSIGYLFLIAGMVYGALEYRKKYNHGLMTYGKAFSSCFMTGLFAGLVVAIYMYVFAQYIHPGFAQEILEKSREKLMTQHPDMPDDQVEIAMQWTAKFTTPLMMMIWGFVAYVFFTVIIGLIASIFLKKEESVGV